jgi:Porin subfamily
MRRSVLVLIAVVLSAAGALAEQPRVQKSGQAGTSGKLMPVKRATPADACAAYGAGFVRIAGSNTCIKIGGAISVGAGGSFGAR